MKRLHDFKIGDKVKPKNIRELMTAHRGSFKGDVTFDMKNIAHKTPQFTISKFDDYCPDTNCYFKEDSGEFTWDLRWFELVKEEKSKVTDIEVITKGNQTKVIIGDKVGIAKCDSSVDSFDSKKGILIATARALKIDKKKVDKIIDVLFDDLEQFTIKDIPSEELIEELYKRL